MKCLNSYIISQWGARILFWQQGARIYLAFLYWSYIFYHTCSLHSPRTFRNRMVLDNKMPKSSYIRTSRWPIIYDFGFMYWPARFPHTWYNILSSVFRLQHKHFTTLKMSFSLSLASHAPKFWKQNVSVSVYMALEVYQNDWKWILCN